MPSTFVAWGDSKLDKQLQAIAESLSGINASLQQIAAALSGPQVQQVQDLTAKLKTSEDALKAAHAASSADKDR